MPDSPTLEGLRVLAHPVRLRILSLLTGAAMSAAEAARELGETQANVSYHLRRLHEAGLLDVAEEVRIRGGLAKRYRHDPESGTRFDDRRGNVGRPRSLGKSARARA
nr:helix-turn-helix domain-containing protein [Amycolatopsis regifaucium]